MSASPAAPGRPLSALVTGASRGIGLAIVDGLLARPGAGAVFATARGAGASEGLAALRADARLRALDMDVTDEASIARAAAQVERETTQLDLVINCAGLLHDGPAMRPERRLADVTPENLQRGYAVNAIGPLLVAKHFHGLFPRAGRAVFASLSARVGSIGDNRLGGWYAYRASKAAQNMFTVNLSIELRRRARGIICVALHPGTVDTALSQPFQAGVAAERLFEPARAARQLLDVIDGLGPHDNGGFFAWDAQRIPW